MNFFYRLVFNFDRSFSGKGRTQIIWLTAVVCFLFAVFYLISFCFVDSDFVFDSDAGDLTDRRLFVITNLFLDSGNMVAAGKIRIFAFIVSFFGLIFFGGVLISVVSNVLERRVERYRNGEISYPMSRHIVILGFDNIALSLIRQLCADPESRRYIVVQAVMPAIDVRRKILTEVSDDDAKRIIVQHGRRNAREDLESLSIWKASEIYITGEHGESDHDSTNVDSMRRIFNVCRMRMSAKPAEPVPCRVMFEYQSSFTPFQVADITKEWRDYLEFLPMNFHEEWAKRIVVDNCYFKEDAYDRKKLEKVDLPPLDYEEIGYGSNKVLHLVIVGMSRLGVAIAVQAAHSLHFPNFLRDCRLKTHITFIDSHADEEMAFFKGRYSGLFSINPARYYEEPDLGNFELHGCSGDSNFLDVEFSFIKGRVESDGVRALLSRWALDTENQLLSVAICFNVSPKSLATGLYLPEELYLKNIPVFVRQTESDALLAFLHKKGEAGYEKYSNVNPVGMMENYYSHDKRCLLRAMAVNYVYDYYYQHGQEPDSIPAIESLKKMWNELSAVNRWSNLYNAYSFAIKSRIAGVDFSKTANLDSDMVDMLSRVEHNRWNMEKLLLGFRAPTSEERCKFANDRSLVKKYKKEYFVHPCICPFDSLSQEMKANDEIIVRAMPVIERFVDGNIGML